MAVLALLLIVGALWVFVFANHRVTSEGSDAAASSATTSSSPSTSSSARTSSSAPTPAEGEWTIGDARSALGSEGSRTLVLGDSTGDHPEEWVHVWAQSQDLPVAAWRTQSEDGYDSESPETRVWSGSMPDATAAYPTEHWDAMWPAEDPDLVVLNLGHAYDSAEEAAPDLESLRKDLAERVPQAPIVVILQNPRADDANAETREAIAEWATDAGLPTIDIAQAFAESDLLPADLRIDEFHPSQAGTELWVATVSEALSD